MALTSTGQKYLDHAKSALPRFLFQLISPPLDILGAYAKMMESFDDQLTVWLTEAYIKTSSGIWLDQHARDYGTTRRGDETDVGLRERLGLSKNVVVARLLLIQINAILVGAGFPGTAVLIVLRRDGAFMSDATPGDTRSYHSRGDLMRRGSRPFAFTVVLPYDTDAPTADAVSEYLRQAKAAGFGHYVERRQSPP